MITTTTPTTTITTTRITLVALGDPFLGPTETKKHWNTTDQLPMTA